MSTIENRKVKLMMFCLESGLFISKLRYSNLILGHTNYKASGSLIKLSYVMLFSLV